jgi:hypothetical protein
MRLFRRQRVTLVSPLPNMSPSRLSLDPGPSARDPQGTWIDFGTEKSPEILIKLIVPPSREHRVAKE